MFIVARRKGQRIFIGNDVEIIVTELSRSTVKIGIVAPKTYVILRGELKESIEAATRAALETVDAPLSELASNDDPQVLDARLATASNFFKLPVKGLATEPVKAETLKP